MTVHLSVDFLDMGRAGDWVIGEARVTRTTRDLAFVEGQATVMGRDLARAAGVFKLMRRRPYLLRHETTVASLTGPAATA